VPPPDIVNLIQLPADVIKKAAYTLYAICEDFAESAYPLPPRDHAAELRRRVEVINKTCLDFGSPPPLLQLLKTQLCNDVSHITAKLIGEALAIEGPPPVSAAPYVPSGAVVLYEMRLKAAKVAEEVVALRQQLDAKESELLKLKADAKVNKWGDMVLCLLVMYRRRNRRRLFGF
jgi:hypothetical protein